jgi:ribosomal protein S18 acetylase RimI-like enzyme
MSVTANPTTRSSLRPGDAEGIVELHRRVYRSEYGLNEEFVARVAEGVRDAVAKGWPTAQGAVRLVDGATGLAGCVALTEEGDGTGRIRWVVLAPELRGSGLGRRMIAEVVEEARRAGLRELRLETFSELRAAAAIYRSLGFRVVSEFERHDWGPPLLYQHYALSLSS